MTKTKKKILLFELVRLDPLGFPSGTLATLVCTWVQASKKTKG